MRNLLLTTLLMAGLIIVLQANPLCAKGRVLSDGEHIVACLSADNHMYFGQNCVSFVKTRMEAVIPRPDFQTVDIRLVKGMELWDNGAIQCRKLNVKLSPKISDPNLATILINSRF